MAVFGNVLPTSTTSSCEPVALARSMAVMAARLARSEPSVASRMRVGKVLNPFPFVAYKLSEGYLEPPPNARSFRCSAVHLALRTRGWVGLAEGAGEARADGGP